MFATDRVLERSASQQIRVDAERLVADIALSWYGLTKR